MAAFEYIALDVEGKQKKDSLEADSSRQVRQILRDKGWTPLEVNLVNERQKGTSAKKSFFFKIRISVVELSMVIRQIAILVNAAIPIEEALAAVAAQQEKSKLKNMLLAIRSRILEGFTLSQGLEAFPEVFPQMYRATVAAGEHSGHLDKILNQLADYSESRMKASQKIQQAMIYPIVLMVVCFGIVGFLLSYVVPDIIKVFIDSGQALPGLTEAIVSASDFFQAYGLGVLLAIILGISLFKYALKGDSFRMRWHKFLLALPLIGKFSLTANSARFSSTLSILTRSSVSLVEALAIAAQVVENDAIKAGILSASKSVSEGASLNKALTSTGYFSPLMLHMIASGEATGDLDRMLERISANQQLELDGKITVALSLLEPFMLLIMGAVVMIIVLAVLLPILNMNELLD